MRTSRGALFALAFIAVAQPVAASPPPDAIPQYVDNAVTSVDAPREFSIDTLFVEALRVEVVSPAVMIETGYRVRNDVPLLLRTIAVTHSRAFHPSNGRARGSTARLNRRIGSPHS